MFMSETYHTDPKIDRCIDLLRRSSSHVHVHGALFVSQALVLALLS